MWKTVGIGLTLLSLSVTITTAAGPPPVYWEEDFTYKKQREWPEKEKDCKEPKQSPVDIQYADLWPEASSPPVRFVNYDRSNQDLQLKLKSNKDQINTVRLWSEGVVTPYVTGGVLFGEPYYFEQALFHWGSTGNPGSEHKVYGTQYTMEVQFVHYPSYENSVKDALEKNSPLLIVSVFLQEYSAFYVNQNLDPLIKAVSQLRKNDDIVSVPGFKLSSLLPARPSYYFRYEGRSSLPKCQAPVQWLVLRTPIYVGAQQVQAFRQLRDTDSKPIGDNFRQTQNDIGRRISMGLAY